MFVIQVHIALPILFLIVCLFLLILPIYIEPFKTGMGAAITVSGIPVYLATVYWKHKPRLYRKIMSKFCHRVVYRLYFTQIIKLMKCITYTMSELGSECRIFLYNHVHRVQHLLLHVYEYFLYI